MRSSSQQAASPSINKRPAQAQALGLPTTATETIKQVAGQLSPFVPFVAALQEMLPRTFGVQRALRARLGDIASSMLKRLLKYTDSRADERAVRSLQFAENREVIGAGDRKNFGWCPFPSPQVI